MFEAKLAKADLLRKLIDAVKELITDASFDCSETGVSLQAMDSSHVALVSLKLEDGAFEDYRCDRTQALGMSLPTLAKILKCATGDDTLTLRHEEGGDSVTLVFDDAKKEKQQECQMKLMDIDQEHLGIPEQQYACTVTMQAAEFAKVIKDLQTFGDSVNVTATKANVQFQTKGDLGTREPLPVPGPHLQTTSASARPPRPTTTRA